MNPELWFVTEDVDVWCDFFFSGFPTQATDSVWEMCGVCFLRLIWWGRAATHTHTGCPRVHKQRSGADEESDSTTLRNCILRGHKLQLPHGEQPGVQNEKHQDMQKVKPHRKTHSMWWQSRNSLFFHRWFSSPSTESWCFTWGDSGSLRTCRWWSCMILLSSSGSWWSPPAR